MNEEMKIILRVNEEAEHFYSTSQELGTLAAEKIGRDHRAQMTSLENIAESTFKVTDVLDYIKKQMSRDKGWSSKASNSQSLGESLKTFLEGRLKDIAARVANDVGLNEDSDEHKRKQQHIYLLLIRQFIRQMVVQYEYLTPRKVD